MSWAGNSVERSGEAVEHLVGGLAPDAGTRFEAQLGRAGAVGRLSGKSEVGVELGAPGAVGHALAVGAA